MPSPFRPDLTDILYRTGDLGAFDAKGSLRIFGRIDDQVKIRGARVEPGEVASALAQHGDLQQAAVAVSNSPEGQFLVAYFVPHPDRFSLDLGSRRAACC